MCVISIAMRPEGAVYVCVRESVSERERQKVCMCVCERERVCVCRIHSIVLQPTGRVCEYVCAYACVCVCVCVCVCARAHAHTRACVYRPYRERGKNKYCVFVCVRARVCVCVYVFVLSQPSALPCYILKYMY